MRVRCARIEAELVVDSKDRVGESPTWVDRSGRLYWVDLLSGRIHHLGTATGEHEILDLATPVSAVAPRRDGGLVVAGGSMFGLIDEGGTIIRALADTGEERGTFRLNDGKCDPQGRFWAGSAVVSGAPDGAGLLRLDPDGKVTRVLGGISMSNGLGWSPDGRTFYYVDTPTQRIDRFDCAPETGDLTNRRVFVSIPRNDGLPDGLTVDAEGDVWLALFGGSVVRRYAPDGTLVQVVQVPASQVTSCTFGGDGLDTLFITTAREGLSDTDLAAEPLAGGVFSCHPGAVGQPTGTFAA